MTNFSSRAGVIALLGLLGLAVVWMVLDSEPSTVFNPLQSETVAEALEPVPAAEAPGEDGPGADRTELAPAEHAGQGLSFSLGDLGKKLFGGGAQRKMHIGGQVLSQGQPVTAATVQVYVGQNFSTHDWKPSDSPTHSIVCDGSGYFDLTLQADSVRLFATAVGYQAKDILEILKGAPAECLDLKLEIFPAQPLAGITVDANGQAVAGATIEVELEQEWSRHRPGEIAGTSYRAINLKAWQSEIDGSFSGEVATGKYALTGSHESAGKSNYHQVVAGDREIVLTLRPQKKDLGSRIFGVVLKPDGRPATQAQLSFSARSKIQKVNREGEFAFTGVKKHWALAPEVEAWAPGSAPTAVVLEELAAEVGPLKIQLPQAHRLSGVVLDSDGKPVADKKLRLSGLPVYGDGSTDRKTILSLFPEGPRSERLDRAVSDSNGEFEFIDLPFAEYTITVEGEGLLPYASAISYPDSQRVVLRQGLLDAPTLTFYGQVVDANRGAMLEGIKVEVHRVTRSGSGWAASSIRNQRTDEAGQFRLEGLDPGEYYLTAEAKGYAQVRQKPTVFEAGEVHIELMMYPTRRVNVQVVDAAEKPVAGASVRVQDPLGNEMMIQLGGGSARTPVSCNEEGRVTMHDMPGGLVKMLVGGVYEQITHEQSVDLRAPGPHDIVLKLSYAVPAEYQRVRLTFATADQRIGDLGPLEFSALDADGFVVSRGTLSRIDGIWQWDSGTFHSDGPTLNALLPGAGGGGQILMTGLAPDTQQREYLAAPAEGIQTVSFEL
jgi:uncharacterized GH25 family protein